MRRSAFINSAPTAANRNISLNITLAGLFIGATGYTAPESLSEDPFGAKCFRSMSKFEKNALVFDRLSAGSTQDILLHFEGTVAGTDLLLC